MKGIAGLLVGVLMFSKLNSPTLNPLKHDCHNMLISRSHLISRDLTLTIRECHQQDLQQSLDLA